MSWLVIMIIRTTCRIRN